MKRSNLYTQMNQFLGSSLLALSLFGFLFPHQVTSSTSRHHVNHRVNMTEETVQSTDDGGYQPPASPGSRRGWQFGS